MHGPRHRALALTPQRELDVTGRVLLAARPDQPVAAEPQPVARRLHVHRVVIKSVRILVREHEHAEPVAFERNGRLRKVEAELVVRSPARRNEHVARRGERQDGNSRLDPWRDAEVFVRRAEERARGGGAKNLEGVTPRERAGHVARGETFQYTAYRSSITVWSGTSVTSVACPTVRNSSGAPAGDGLVIQAASSPPETNDGAGTGSALYSGTVRGLVGSARSTSGVRPAVPNRPASTNGPYMIAWTVASSGVGSAWSAIGRVSCSRSPSRHALSSTR